MFSHITNFFGILKPSQNTYHTDIINLICSCEDWKQKRQHYPSDDPRRLCKHIVKNLDTNNLPSSMKYYKETIQYYQDNEKGFNKFDFDKVINLLRNDLIILGSDENIYENWMNVYDKAGNQYGFFASEWGGFTWAKDKKPNGYEEVEEYFSKPSMQLPIRLQVEEKEDLIQFIKEKIPSKQHYYLEIVDDQYIASSHGVFYRLMESKISKSEEQRLLSEFQKNKYSDEYEPYRLASEAARVPYDAVNEVDQIIVKNDEIIIQTSFQSYNYCRDYEKAKVLFEKKRLNEEKIFIQQEREWENNLALKREKAKDKGYLFTADYRSEEWQEYQGSKIEYDSPKDKILRLYDRSFNLLKETNEKITVEKFNKILAGIGILTKCDGLNNSSWILIGDGLNYGINFVQSYSQYTHVSIPEWYIMVDFDDKTSSLQKETRQGFMNMTTILWKKEKFQELLNLVIANLEMTKEKTKKKAETKVNGISKKQAEREEWLQFV
ncbi:MAG TPA: hypothetical protein PLA07_10685, partial [Sulfuricurvum sp.]|nr:hypothetical protein [Sulfuricurvum sp.]